MREIDYEQKYAELIRDVVAREPKRSDYPEDDRGVAVGYTDAKQAWQQESVTRFIELARIFGVRL